MSLPDTWALSVCAKSGLSAGNRIVYRNSQLCEFPSSIVVFHVRYFKTSAARRDDVVTVNTPPFSESITEGDVRWEKAVGDSVKEDEVVCEIETDKTSLQVPSPAAGVITELLVPDGGRVEAGNPLFKLKKGVSAVKPTAPAPAPAPAAPEAHGTRKESRVKMNRMRLRIAQRLKEAQETCAMLTTFNEIDMSNIQEMRTLHKDAFLKRHNIKLGFMDYVDISVAVATPKGLVVPVIRNVETMNFADIEKTINGLGEKARNNTLAVEDMDGGTFTISNGGVFGSMFGTPIINPPQSAILGMHGIFDRPVAIGGKIQRSRGVPALP
ncbi:unnamed protein product [Coregonus sp. 'balchen']|nr:unnamed protein product [Coregonus sp. 'balchen']